MSREKKKQDDEKLDEALEASFPASDPVSFTISQAEEEGPGSPCGTPPEPSREKRDRESRTTRRGPS